MCPWAAQQGAPNGFSVQSEVKMADLLSPEAVSEHVKLNFLSAGNEPLLTLPCHLLETMLVRLDAFITTPNPPCSAVTWVFKG
jgi:hypothetical protein